MSFCEQFYGQYDNQFLSFLKFHAVSVFQPCVMLTPVELHGLSICYGDDFLQFGSPKRSMNGSCSRFLLPTLGLTVDYPVCPRFCDYIGFLGVLVPQRMLLKQVGVFCVVLRFLFLKMILQNIPPVLTVLVFASLSVFHDCFSQFFYTVQDRLFCRYLPTQVHPSIVQPLPRLLNKKRPLASLGRRYKGALDMLYYSLCCLPRQLDYTTNGDL